MKHNVEALKKYYVNATKEEVIEDMYKDNCYLQQKIERAIEYIENNYLYEEEYDYDYEENSYLSGIDDEQAKKDLLEILKEE